jgi:hypothetical protein
MITVDYLLIPSLVILSRFKVRFVEVVIRLAVNDWT